MCVVGLKNMVFANVCQLEEAERLLIPAGGVEGKNCQRNWKS